jgi:MFS family permease
VTDTGLAGATATAATGRSGFRRLLISLGIASGALSALYGGVGNILLPLQIERIDRPHKVVALAVVAGVSAAFALVFNPIGGALSDRTRSRFGRRAPWLVILPLPLIVLVAFLGQAGTVLLVLVGWCLTQAVANLYQAPLTAVVPDRISVRKRGVASSVTGVAAVLGGVTGVGLASLFTARIESGYLVLGCLLWITAIGFVLSTHDRSSADMPRLPPDTRGLGARLSDFLSALRHRDFALVFAGRAFAILGYYLILEYELYILTDYIHLPGAMKPAQGVTVLAAISAVGAILAAAIAGPISDRLDRRKPFVIISSVIAGAGCILPVISPTFTTIEIFAALAGLAFGCYLSVDAALVTLVLPTAEDAARDLGVLNIANAGPQVIAPLFAAIIIGNLGGYRTLFLVGGCCGIGSAIAVMGVRSVR